MRDKMPALVEAVQQAGQVVTWVCDPMHGNTESCGRYKTRRFDNVRAEVRATCANLQHTASSVAATSVAATQGGSCIRS